MQMPGRGKTQVILAMLPWWKRLLIRLRLPCPGVVVIRFPDQPLDVKGFLFPKE